MVETLASAGALLVVAAAIWAIVVLVRHRDAIEIPRWALPVVAPLALAGMGALLVVEAPVDVPAVGPEHMTGPVFALLGGLAATLGITFLVVARLPRLDVEDEGERHALETEARRFLLGFPVATAGVAVLLSGAGLAVAPSTPRHAVDHDTLLAACAGGVLVPLLGTAMLLVVFSGQPSGAILAAPRLEGRSPFNPFAALRYVVRRVSRLGRTCAWLLVPLVVGGIGVVVVARLLGGDAARVALLVAAIGWVVAYWRTRAGRVDQHAAATTVAPRSPLTFWVLVVAYAAAANGLAVLGDPLADQEPVRDVYGLIAAVNAAALVVFAAGEPTAARRPVTRVEASRWEAAAAVGLLGLAGAVAGTAWFDGPLLFWDAVAGTAAMLVALVARVRGDLASPPQAPAGPTNDGRSVDPS